MDAEMTDVKDHHIEHQEDEEALHHEKHHLHHHHHHHEHEHEHEHDEHMDDTEANAAAVGGEQHYEQHYDESYAQQYEEGAEVVEGVGEALYEGQEGEYEQGADGVSFEVAVDAAAAVASAAAAHVDHEGEYAEEQQPQEYAEQQEYAGHEGYMDESQQQYAEQGEDDQTLAAHPATTRDMESMVVDGEGGAISSEVTQAMTRYDYAPDGLQTLAATSSAVTPHDTPSRYSMHSHQKPMMPKFNRARNWTTEETKILLVELERIASGHPDDRRETVLRSHSTFEEIAEILREKGYSNRDGQGCMIRWRNLLRVYKQLRAQSNEGNPPSGHPNMQYASAIENIYRFPPDSLHYLHSEGSPGLDGSPAGLARTWSAANGSYETPARKRTREINLVTEHIDSVDQKLEQTMEYLSQQNEILRSLEERLTRTEEALKASEVALDILNTTIGEKDAKRDELEKQLMVTVQALSQVIATKKAEDQQQQQ